MVRFWNFVTTSPTLMPALSAAEPDSTVATSAPTDVEAFELLLGLGMPFAKEGRPGSRDAEAEAAAEEERRKEEARQRAEAEQAALEQLKEENPDAYAKPEPEAEAGEESEGETEQAEGSAGEESSDDG